MQVLRSLGLQPHMLACRSTDELEDSVRDKLGLFCQVPPDSVLGMHDVSNIWQVCPAASTFAASLLQRNECCLSSGTAVNWQSGVAWRHRVCGSPCRLSF